MKHPITYAAVFGKVMLTLLGFIFFLEMWTSGSVLAAVLMATGIVLVCIQNDKEEASEAHVAEHTSPTIACPICQGTGQVRANVRFVSKGVLVDLVPTILPCPCCEGHTVTTQLRYDTFTAQA
ncbi:hypothetical protein [Deinococcus ficus]|uniref:Uncharacterized protein n=1 Tax=Deinococcus ficus TaxID=317577 RepID=A0A221T333_9DEIO|nr:hypothetical protein [Deinococcus ficus]ASN83281.1 hypothetical protein DFI_18965 [Deinococcus ficus]